MKRFYKEVSVATGAGGHQILLDGRPIGTGRPGPMTRQLRERFGALVRQ